MNYDSILSYIKPDQKEKAKVEELSKKIINFLDNLSLQKDIPSKAVLVGSVAKGTWLSGKADIDIFLNFPLETSLQNLKKNGLFLGHECIKKMGGMAEERYASHPYVTGTIDGYEIDFVPCYAIENSSQIKSAVDRTNLHNIYIQQNLKSEQLNEVLLLKKFMYGVETYGSEFKVGGFAGYLCELLILKYSNFEGVLKAAAHSWEPGLIIDLENYDTGENFTEPLVVVDPVDKNRNVAAALTLQKMSEFVAASRNFLSEPKEEYFSKINLNGNSKLVEKLFTRRGTETILISFKPPEVPSDAIYPQLKKTADSMSRKLSDEGFIVENNGYWTDEIDLAVIILELSLWSLPDYKKNVGPELWNEYHSSKFLEKYGNQAYLEKDRWVVDIPRKQKDIYIFLNYYLQKENIHHLKTGKHLKKKILQYHEIHDVSDFLGKNPPPEILDFLFRFLNPGQQLWR
ncbi:MAG: CCA tRNA nucleotidyltransferase [Euryarchaeota archaeon]|nr:CCA tRNA nucleotidyltransferase [Euryarchaeota archaeon]MBV1730217.1 CCA tRNA nucleotidyltransferase [Methanobacterium sp.]MBV1754015.1 CCA tRNA nucleotidyltransferase [Methanobacterium sp.]